jgi:serine protease Do
MQLFLKQTLSPLALALALSVPGGLVATAPAAHAQSAPQRGVPDFTELAEQVSPAVVNIRTLERTRAPSAAAPDDETQEFFRRFFGQPLPGTPRGGQRPGQPGQPGQGDGESQPRGVGSGFILSADGYVMTNAHVVDGAEEVIVTLADKREFKARVVGTPDRRTDVAVLKIEASGLPLVRIGDVSRLKVGEWVMAIGSPFGLENTVTAGIVSAKQRDTGDYLPFIQTDVAINPGNSGGPLINLRGEVVGINSQIYSRSGGFMGISFAIPIDEAMRVADQLRSPTGRVSRGRIGVAIDQVTKDVAESIGLGRPQGALVRSVESGSPADKAGVEAGDIILRFDGKLIERASDLPRQVGNTKPGSRSTVTVFRRGAQRDLSLVVAEIEPDRSERRASAPQREERPRGSAAAQSLGLTVAELTEAQRKELKLKGGVRVEAAADAAVRAGMREGDVIVSVGNAEVANLREFEAAIARADRSRPIAFLVRRGEQAVYLLVRPTR